MIAVKAAAAVRVIVPQRYTATRRKMVFSSSSVTPWRCNSRRQRRSFGTSSSDESNRSEGVARCKISFLTDVEGDKAYFDRFVSNSPFFAFTEVVVAERTKGVEFFPYSHRVDFVREEAVLVCGGDMWDKGGRDLYVTRQLLSLRRRYGPHRVYFIMGNRDVNKLRILQEVGISTASLPKHGGVFWFAGTGRTGDPHIVSTQEVPSDSKAHRLKWILERTMGSPDAFELRRSELLYEKALLGHTGDVSDEEVVQSYQDSCHPVTGVMGRYLSQAQLVLKLGSVLFLHGALPLTDDVLASLSSNNNHTSNEACDTKTLWSNFDFAMPWRKDDNTCHTLDDWIRALNTFARDQVTHWAHSITNMERSNGHNNTTDNTGQGVPWSSVGGYDTSSGDENRTYGSLIQYGMGTTPDKRKNPTVVYASWLTDGMPRRFYDEDDASFVRTVRSFFRSFDLRLILTGHQPHGDLPTPIRIDEDGRFILACDTSYSGDTHWIPNNDKTTIRTENKETISSGRGPVAVSEVILEQCTTSGEILSLYYHGVLSDGSHYETSNLFSNEEDDTNLVGKLVDRTKLSFDSDDEDDDEDRWWVKAKLIDGTFVVSKGKGYDVYNSIAHPR